MVGEIVGYMEVWVYCKWGMNVDVFWLVMWGLIGCIVLVWDIDVMVDFDNFVSGVDSFVVLVKMVSFGLG